MAKAKKKPEIPKKLWMPKFRTADERDQDRKQGVAYLDPEWESPSYVHGYVAAARSLAGLMDADRHLLDDLGLPLLYLIRHTVELILKALLSDALEIASYRRALERDDGFAAPWEMAQALDTSHDLRGLLGWLKEALTKLALDQPKPSLPDLVETIAKYEGGNEAAFRYAYRRKHGQRTRTFQSTVRFPVLDLQKRLDVCFDEHMMDQHGMDEEQLEKTLQGKLWAENNSLLQLEGAMEAAEEEEEAQKRAFKEATLEFDKWLKAKVQENGLDAAVFAVCRKQLVETVRAKLGLEA